MINEKVDVLSYYILHYEENMNESKVKYNTLILKQHIYGKFGNGYLFNFRETFDESKDFRNMIN